MATRTASGTSTAPPATTIGTAGPPPPRLAASTAPSAYAAAATAPQTRCGPRWVTAAVTAANTADAPYTRACAGGRRPAARITFTASLHMPPELRFRRRPGNRERERRSLRLVAVPR
ncbi:hypothetical protein Acsp04_01090 [Actinomadura sp. NBRC 104425]|nr:hypothetical protein Acsp04_01090 [Actinomadura sp. NBRC 104425]